MYFNFKLFSVLAAKAYRNLGSSDYTLSEVLAVFEYYFSRYEAEREEAHPNIRMEQIERIIVIMPSLDDAGNRDIDPEGYEVLIDKHFLTQYRNCDYNINHFFSGDIRQLRLYEELY